MSESGLKDYCHSGRGLTVTFQDLAKEQIQNLPHTRKSHYESYGRTIYRALICCIFEELRHYIRFKKSLKYFYEKLQIR